MDYSTLSDRELVASYNKEVADRKAKNLVGVDYFLAQMMERRGLRNPRTAELTAKGRRLS